ncbi:extracellular solute-binding protein [Rubellimicrobium arenae]|uniref:extracellular solute-binding protein n=1 Tax=Rubellimicrobium arenae TaxID=2817372 RepID=UPI001B30FB9B|nr:extracellular solute-binding protein [Rubellimicrobium arenae]
MPGPRRRATALALAPALDMRWAGLGALALAATLAAWPALSQDVAGDVTAAAGVEAQGVTVSHGYSTFGDLKYPADFQHLDYVNPEAPKGGEISIWAQGTFDTFNPYSREGRAAALSNIGYESLLTGTADEVSSLYCLLCETLEYPEDRSWITFHMRPEAHFSDGTPITAEDVVFSHNLLVEQGLPSYAAIAKTLIAKVEALDEHTVKWTLAEGAEPRDAFSLAGGTPVWSKAWFDKTGSRLDKTSYDISPGSGPYVLDSYDVNRRVVYRRDPNYWGQDLPINVGRYNFDRIRVEYFADTDVAFEAFKAGEYTFRQENSSLVWATRYDFPSLSKGWVLKEELPNGNLPPAVGVVFNLRDAKFQDLRVRQALALMFNFAWTNETLQYGLFQQRESFWQNSELQARGVPEGKELDYLQSVADLVDPAILTEPVTVPHESSAESQFDRGNLRQALRLMEEAGWTPDDTGHLVKDGQRFSLEIMLNAPSLERVLTPYADNLRRLLGDGTVSIEVVDPAQYTDRERNFDWEMIYDGYDNSLEESLGLQQRYGSQGVGDVFNPAGYSSPAVDKLIGEVVAAQSYDDMAAAVRAIDRIIRREMIVVPTWYNPNYWVAYYDMYRHPDPLPPYALGSLDFWWFDADKAAELRSAGAFK